MKRKKTFILIAVFIVVIYISQWSSYFATGAIRKYVFNNFNKIQAFTLWVGIGGYVDGGKLGKQYFVHGVTDSKSGGSINFFYLKKDKYGKWYVSSCGSGP